MSDLIFPKQIDPPSWSVNKSLSLFTLVLRKDYVAQVRLRIIFLKSDKVSSRHNSPGVMGGVCKVW